MYFCGHPPWVVGVASFAFALSACSPEASDTKPEAGVEREATPDTAPPAPAAPAAADDPAVTKALRGISEDPATLFATARADLNGDGAMELLVYPYGPGICGTGGCNLIVLTPDGDGFHKAGDTSVVRTPVRLLTSSTNGWRDLSVSIGGGGIESGQVKLTFDGKAYPRNPTVLPADARVDGQTGSVLITDPPAGKALPQDS